MKKKRIGKVLVVIASICVIIGAMLVGAGFARGGNIDALHVGKDNTEWWPFSANVGLYYRGSAGMIMIDDENINPSKGNHIWEQELDANDKWDIKVDMGDIVVKKGSKTSIKVQNIDKSYVSLKKDDGVQVIQVKHPNNKLHNKEAKIELTLPENEYTIEIENKLGDITISDLTFRKMEIEDDLGDIQLSNIESKATEIDEKSGDISLKGSFTGKTSIENNLGDIHIEMTGKRDEYYLKISNDLGDTTINEDVYELHCKLKQNQGGKHLLEVDNNLGDINIQFR